MTDIHLGSPRLSDEERDRTETRAYAEVYNKLVPHNLRIRMDGKGISKKQAVRLGYLVEQMRDGRARAAAWMLKACIRTVKKASCLDEAVGMLEDELETPASRPDTEEEGGR